MKNHSHTLVKDSSQFNNPQNGEEYRNILKEQKIIRKIKKFKIIAREWNRKECKDPEYVEHKNKLRREGNRNELHKKNNERRFKIQN